MNRPMLIGLIMLLVSALITGFYVLRRGRQPQTTTQEVQTVLVAAKDIERWEPIVAEEKPLPDVLKELNLEKPPDNAAQKLDEVSNMMATSLITKGQIITREMFEPIPERGFVVLMGNRAVALYMSSEEGIAGLIKEGDLVDVMVSKEVTLEGGAKGTVTRTVAQRAKVLKVNTLGGVPSAGGGQQSPPPPAGGEQQPVVTRRQIVLQVTPQQARHIVEAEAGEGKIYLVLRNEADYTVVPEPIPPPKPRPKPQDRRLTRLKLPADAKRLILPPPGGTGQVVARESPKPIIIIYKGDQREEVEVRE